MLPGRNPESTSISIVSYPNANLTPFFIIFASNCDPNTAFHFIMNLTSSFPFPFVVWTEEEGGRVVGLCSTSSVEAVLKAVADRPMKHRELSA